MRLSRRATTWLAFNGVGLVLFLLASSALWPAVRGICSRGPGDGLLFGLTVLPVVASCLILNLSVAVYILLRRRQFVLVALWVVVMGAWVGVVRYDSYRNPFVADCYP
jgi:hypothetical protein